jgi:hypothetical protein
MSLVHHWPFYKNSTLKDAASTVELGIVRATESVSKDDYGFLTTVPANYPVFPGAAHRVNDIPYSNDLNSGDWTFSTNASATSNAAVAPDGTVTASLLKSDAIGGNINTRRPFDFYEGHTYMFTWYTKAGDVFDWGYFGLSTAAFPVSITMYYDLTNGVMGTVGAGITYSDIEAVDDAPGWYKITAVSTCDATTLATSCFWNVAEANGDITLTAGNDGEGIYMWGLGVRDVSGRWSADNQGLQSESLDTGWSNTGTTETDVTSSVTPPISSISEVWQVTQDTSTTRHDIAGNSVFAPGSRDRVIESIYVKPNSEVNYSRFLWGGSDNPGWVKFDFANETGTVGSGSTGAQYIEDAGVINEGNGWYRLYAIHHPLTLSTLNVSLLNAEATSRLSTEVGSTDRFAYVTGYQYERARPGQTRPSKYIPTTTAGRWEYENFPYLLTEGVAASDTSGPSDGLRKWPGRTNIVVQSSDMSTTWTSNQATPEYLVAIAPDGSKTANRLVDDGLTGDSTVSFQQNLAAISTSTDYVASVWLKKDQLTWAKIGLEAYGTQVIEQYFDLANGVVGTPGAAVNDSGMEDDGNGWYRCWLTWTSDVADTLGNLLIYCADSDGDNSVTRDGTSSIYVWEGQVETGTYPSPLIRTAATSETRNKEQEVELTSLTDLSEQEGTLYAETADKKGATGMHVLNVSDGSNQDFVVLQENGAIWYVLSSGSISVTAGLTTGTDRKFLGTWNKDIAKSYTDGVKIATDTSVVLPLPPLTQINIGNNYSGSGSDYYGLIKEAAVSTEAIPESQALQLTGGGTTVELAMGGGNLTRRNKLARDRWRRRYRRT